MPEPIIASNGESQAPISATGTTFDVHEWSGSGPDYLHVHYSDDEAWHVLEGELTFRFLDREVVAGPGTTVFAPAGVAHAYWESQGPSRYLIILTPGLRELISELHSTPFKDHGEVMRKYDSEILK